MRLRIGLALVFALATSLPVALGGLWLAADIEARARAHAAEQLELAVQAATRDAAQLEAETRVASRGTATWLERALAASPAGEERHAAVRAALARRAPGSLALRAVLDHEGAWIAGEPPIASLDAAGRRALAGECALVRAGTDAEAPLAYACGQTLAAGELALVGVDVARFTALGQVAGVELAVTVGPSPQPPAEGATGSTVDERVVRELGGADASLARVLVARRDLGPELASAHRVRAQTLVLAGALVLAGLVLGVLVGTLVSRPLRELESAASRIGKGDLQVTLSRAPGGASATYSAFNRMARDLQDAQQRAKRAERVAAWRDIARRIAHEIKNPLTPIRMSIETMRRTRARQHPDIDEIFEESTRTVLEEVERMERIVTEFSRFARLPRPSASELDVREIVTQVVALQSPGGDATITDTSPRTPIKLTLSERVPLVRADRDQLTQVILNLVQNAAQAAEGHRGEQGHVEVIVEPSASGGVRVVVQDDGPGIPLEERSRVFEPYYTTKAGGTGLGLAIVDRIVSEHGGSIRLGESRWGGARFEIELSPEGPIEDPEASATT